MDTNEIVETTVDNSSIIASTRNGFRAKATGSGTQRNGGKGPSADWVESFSSLSSTTLFLMARQGPTVFIVKNENEGIFKVVIGQPHQCSCANSHHPDKKKRRSLPAIEEGNSEENNTSERITDASSRLQQPQPPQQQQPNNSGWCQHLLFCLIKVLKIPKEHPLCYKLSMTNSEIDQVLNGLTQYEARKIPKRAMRQKRQADTPNDTEDDSNSNIDDSNPNYVQRQSISDSADSGENSPDSCPICQDDMYKGQCLTWCRTGCGNNMHAKCMMQYCKFKMSNQQKPGCPLCRDDWNMELLQQDCLAKEKKAASASSKSSSSSSKSSQGKGVKHLLPINCSNCTCLLRNTFHRCIECSFRAYKTSLKTVDVCGECFNRMSHGPTAAYGIHAGHHFLSSCNTALTNINEVHWAADQYPIHGAPRLSQQREATVSNIQTTLMDRELDVNDYDMLLNLDAGVQLNVPEVSDLLVDALPTLPDDPSGSAAANRCWCATAGHHGGNIGKARRLLCGHFGHDFCLRNELFDFLSSADTSAFNGMPLATFSCPHSECEQKVFPYLNRRKEATAAATADSNAAEKEVVGGKPDLGINIVGSNLSVAGHNIGSSSNSSNSSGTTTNTFNVTNTSRSTGNLDSASLGQVERHRLSSISAAGSRRLRAAAANSRANGSNTEEGDGCGLYVRGMQSNSNSNSISNSNFSSNPSIDSSYHNVSNNELALPSLAPAQRILTNQRDPLRRPPRPNRVGLGPTRLQPISLVGSGLQNSSSTTDSSIAETSFAPLISSSQINSKLSGKSSIPNRLPALSGRLSPIDTSSVSSTQQQQQQQQQQHVIRSPEKRIHYTSNRNSSNYLKKVGDVLVQRILNGDGEEGNSFIEEQAAVDSNNNDGGLVLNCVAYGKAGKNTKINMVDRKRSARHSSAHQEEPNNNHNTSSISSGSNSNTKTNYSYDYTGSAMMMNDSEDEVADNSHQYSTTTSRAGKLRKGLSMQSVATNKQSLSDFKGLSINGAT